MMVMRNKSLELNLIANQVIKWIIEKQMIAIKYFDYFIILVYNLMEFTILNYQFVYRPCNLNVLNLPEISVKN